MNNIEINQLKKIIANTVGKIETFNDKKSSIENNNSMVFSDGVRLYTSKYFREIKKINAGLANANSKLVRLQALLDNIIEKCKLK